MIWQARDRNVRSQRGIVITALIASIVREPDGDGWLVLTPRGHAWLHGSRQAALDDKRWLDHQWRAQR
jgi:hypothetical protein